MGYFKNINFLNFRNFEQYSIEFSSNNNVFYGKNGSGKTNVLEGVSLLSRGRGFRKDKLSNIINKNFNKFVIKSDFENNNTTYKLVSETKLENNRFKKILSVNNDKELNTLKNIYEFFPLLYFLPETERLFTSSPSNRRNFIDQLIFTYKNTYNKIINKYNKYLQERSKLLNSDVADESWLIELEKNISILGCQIYKFREKQINITTEYLNHNLNKFDLSYYINIRVNDVFCDKNLDQEFYEKELKKNRLVDSITGGSKIGPHKSDYIFMINEKFLASQLSTGQQKTLILLIYLSHCEFLIGEISISPILLLDEICSHLDEINRKILLALIETLNLQVFMTGTTKNLFSFLSTNTNFCNIED